MMLTSTLAPFGWTLIAMQAASATPVAPTYLSRADVVAGLVDGQPWNMANTDGRNGRIRFNADGTGAIESPIQRRIRWTTDSNRFCMRMGFLLGTRCFQATRISTGFQGYTDGRASVRFTR
ncbi:MAG: hypothetical protein IBJ12_05925 [Sphingomonadaceae bacterium]|nr:hypothetical protein [Sphingomonadaceae bacterium]